MAAGTPKPSPPNAHAHQCARSPGLRSTNTTVGATGTGDLLDSTDLHAIITSTTDEADLCRANTCIHAVDHDHAQSPDLGCVCMPPHPKHRRPPRSRRGGGRPGAGRAGPPASLTVPVFPPTRATSRNTQ